MRCTYRLFSLAFVVCAGMAASDAAAGTIYYDSFSGSSSTDLVGQSPAVRPTNETWNANSFWKADGSISDSADLTSAWLPFVPVAGRAYELSLTMSVTTNPNDAWLAAGFSSLANPGTGDLYPFYESGVYGWGLKKGPDSVGDENAFYTAPGAGLEGLTKYGAIAGPMTYDVVLDTRPESWTVEWFLDGSSIRGPVAIGTPTIQNVGFGSLGIGLVGSVDNFTLTVDVPEPSSILLLSVSMLLGLTCYAWRKR